MNAAHQIIDGLSTGMAVITLVIAVAAIVRKDPGWMDSSSTFAGVASIIFTIRIVVTALTDGDRFSMITSAVLVVMFTALVIACRSAAVKIRGNG